MATTLKARVEAYVGTITDTGLLEEWMKAASRQLVDLLPESKARPFIQLFDQDDMSTDDMFRIFGVRHKANRMAREVPFADFEKYLDENSIHLADDLSPVWARSHGVAKISLAPADAGDLTEILAIAYPDPSNTDTSLLPLSPDFTQAVVLYAAIQFKHKELYAKTAALTAVAVAAKTPPTPPAAPSFTWSDATASSATPSFVDDEGWPTAPAWSMNKPTAATRPDLASKDVHPNVAEYTDGDQDIELALAKAKHGDLYLSEFMTDVENYTKIYASEIQDSLGTFNASNTNFQAYLQKTIEDAKAATLVAVENAKFSNDVAMFNKAKALEEQVAEYTATLQLYGGQVQQYVAEVNEEAARVTAELQKIGGTHAQAVQQLQALIAEYRFTLQLVLGLPLGNEKETK